MNEVLDETEAAALLDCEPSTVQDKARSGELPAVKFGRSWRFPRAALLEALNRKAMENMTKAAATPKPKAVQMATVRRLPPVLPTVTGNS